MQTIEEDRLSQNNEPAETAETPGDLDQKSIEENNTHENDTESDHEGKFETHESNKIPDFPTPDTTNDTEVDASLEENENLGTFFSKKACPFISFKARPKFVTFLHAHFSSILLQGMTFDVCNC